ncbi:MAG: taurine dioxygenase, partial [Gammaproteobacteria bacterium]
MNVRQLPILGAEIRGLDLSKDLTEAENKEIKDLLTENLVLIVKDQNLLPKDLVRIASSWGGAFEHPVFKG